MVESSFRPKITILRIVTFHDVSHPMVNLKNEDGKNKKSLSVNTTRVHKEVPNEVSALRYTINYKRFHCRCKTSQDDLATHFNILAEHKYLRIGKEETQ